MRGGLGVLLIGWSLAGGAAAQVPLRLDAVPAVAPGPILLVSGAAQPWASIAVEVNGHSQGVFRADATGRFQRAVGLGNGVNNLRLIAIEELPAGATGLVDHYSVALPQQHPFRPSGGLRPVTYSNGVLTTWFTFQEKPAAGIGVYANVPAGLRWLEMRFRNGSPYQKLRLTVLGGNPRQPVEQGSVDMTVAPYMTDFETRRFDLAAIAGASTGTAWRSFQIQFVPPRVRVDDPQHYGRGSVGGTGSPLELDYVKFYGLPEGVESAAPPDVTAQVRYDGAPFADKLSVIRQRILAERTTTTNRLEWARSFEAVERARLAAEACDYATARDALVETIRPAGEALP